MFKIIFMFMLLFLALASLTTFNHLFMNQFITEQRDTFNLTKIIKEQCLTHRMANKRWHFILMLVFYGQIISGHSFPDIYGQIIVAHPSECIHLHCYFTLQLNIDKWNRRCRKRNVYNYSLRVYNASFPICKPRTLYF